MKMVHVFTNDICKFCSTPTVLDMGNQTLNLMEDCPQRKAEAIFVFGSNEAGIHGAGAAATASMLYGAVDGKGEGLQGQSYALPTKGKNRHGGIGRPLTNAEIKPYVDNFVQFAKDNPDKEFVVTQIGCGYAGKQASDIAPMFVGAPDNCFFDEAWKPWLGDVNYWGTF